MSANYTKEIREHLHYSATWLPDVEVRLGDIVELTGNTYRRVASSTDDFDIVFSTRESKGKGSIDYVSADRVKFNIIGSGSGPEVLAPQIDLRAGIEIEFTTENAVFFQAGPYKILEIESLKSMSEKILELYKNAKWNERYVLITEVLRAKRTTVLISSAAGAKAVFKANADVKFLPTKIIDVNAGLELVSYQNLGTKTVSQNNLTPLFRGFAIRKPLFHQPRFGPIRSESQLQPTFEAVDYEDFASS